MWILAVDLMCGGVLCDPRSIQLDRVGRVISTRPRRLSSCKGFAAMLVAWRRLACSSPPVGLFSPTIAKGWRILEVDFRWARIPHQINEHVGLGEALANPRAFKASHRVGVTLALDVFVSSPHEFRAVCCLCSSLCRCHTSSCLCMCVPITRIHPASGILRHHRPRRGLRIQRR